MYPGWVGSVHTLVVYQPPYVPGCIYGVSLLPSMYPGGMLVYTPLLWYPGGMLGIYSSLMYPGRHAGYVASYVPGEACWVCSTLCTPRGIPGYVTLLGTPRGIPG